ncbi:hypothetical protein ElyMa_002696200 [Elysia marginata]|uniref:Uncharacterized protein n=1 Tax=Elysia marginata TaxID=1093978 RepID=A0AAV4HCV2_9GAST|nr:hypothetical protein ElyMa_002696200 [Elysia marginata]
MKTILAWLLVAAILGLAFAEPAKEKRGVGKFFKKFWKTTKDVAKVTYDVGKTGFKVAKTTAKVGWAVGKGTVSAVKGAIKAGKTVKKGVSKVIGKTIGDKGRKSKASGF